MTEMSQPLSNTLKEELEESYSDDSDLFSYCSVFDFTGDGYLRYMLPVMGVMPLLVSYTLQNRNNS